MAWNNNNNRSKGNYRNNGGNNQNNGGGNDQPRKKSGCKSGVNKNGNRYVSGWNKSRSRGYITFIAFPYHSTSIHESNSGRQWENWIIKITQGTVTTMKPCLHEVATGRVICKELGLIANPKTNYFGTMFRKS